MGQAQVYDVVVIGAGIAGLRTADLLSEEGRTVLVVGVRLVDTWRITKPWYLLMIQVSKRKG